MAGWENPPPSNPRRVRSSQLTLAGELVDLAGVQCLVHPVADASQPAAAARRCGSGALPSYCRGMHSHSESATSGLPLDYKGNAHNSATFFPGGIRNCFSAPRATLPWPIIIYQRGGIPLSTTCASLRRPDDPFTSIRRIEA